MAKGKSKKKKIIILAVVFLVIAIATVGATTAFRNKKEGVSVDILTLTKGGITVTVPANGVLEEIEKHTIFTETTTKVLSIEVKEGDYVQKGQMLAMLDTKDLGNQLAIKRNLLEMDKIDLAKLEVAREETIDENNRRVEGSLRTIEDTKKTLMRNTELYNHGAISKEEFEASERAYEDAKRAYGEAAKTSDIMAFDIEKMKKKIEITKLEIADMEREVQKQEDKIISPIEGMVTAINLEEGGFTNPTNPSFIISNIEDLAIEINVSEYDIAKVEVGQEVEIETDALSGTTFKGFVERVAPVAKRLATGQTTETVIPVTIKVKENHELLKPGFSVKTKIISQQKEDVLVIPFDAIILEQNGAKIVFVVREDILHKVEVQTGIESDFDIEIIRGLEVGDKIVLNPSMTLTEGMKVIVNERQQKEK
ncbi:efflux RND transporter periplasmic adaptor subunit [Natronincola ferrireducens]|uniref:RND family efflux transporter, MFP subunit n=1 Tax=Natronincola ferrireducens TaxID=393762 RepID=A0A1G8XSU0_9FIRM|nr:efflux RND transporter periplasmic adaptor subunit [Natronincola ferrireducens]SDJ93659.1 RND family efflux transporter, MFP subunit [Natronincola ferrireducens]